MVWRLLCRSALSALSTDWPLLALGYNQHASVLLEVPQTVIDVHILTRQASRVCSHHAV
jgi:hypothetical protein